MVATGVGEKKQQKFREAGGSLQLAARSSQLAGRRFAQRAVALLALSVSAACSGRFCCPAIPFVPCLGQAPHDGKLQCVRPELCPTRTRGTSRRAVSCYVTNEVQSVMGMADDGEEGVEVELD